MLIDWNEEVNGRTELFNIVVVAYKDAIYDAILKHPVAEDGSRMIPVILTVAGKEVDVKKVIDGWQPQIERMVQEAAKELIDDGCRDILNSFDDLMEELKGDFNTVVTSKLEQRMSNCQKWAKYIEKFNWDTVEVEKGDIQLNWMYIREGISGEYNSKDEDDIPLLRFSIRKKEYVDDLVQVQITPIGIGH